MKVKIDMYGDTGSITCIREEDDPKFYGIVHAKGEHAFMHFLKKWLNERGCNLIKKLIWKDGHLMGDDYQPYLRTKSNRSAGPHMYIYNGRYAIEGAEKHWNDGEVKLHLHTNIFKSEIDWMQNLYDLANEDIEVKVS